MKDELPEPQVPVPQEPVTQPRWAPTLPGHTWPAAAALLVVVLLACAAAGHFLVKGSSIKAPSDSGLTETTSNSLATTDQSAILPCTGKEYPIQICKNSLYMNGLLIAADIPASLNLPPSTLPEEGINTNEFDVPVSAQGLFSSYNGFSEYGSDNDFSYSRDIGSTDVYASPATSTTGLFALIYIRLERSDPTEGYDQVKYAAVLEYDAHGLVKKFPITSTDILPDDSVLTWFDQSHAYLYQVSQKESAYVPLYQFPENKFIGDFAFGLDSPDGSRLAVYPETSDQTVFSCDGMAAISQQEVDLFDYPAGTLTPITNDTTQPYFIFGWSPDSERLLVLYGPKGESCDSGTYASHFTNYFTYDVSSGMRQDHQLPADKNLAPLCGTGQYVCNQEWQDFSTE